MEIGTEDCDLDAPVSGTGGWDEAVDSGQLEWWDWWRGVKVEENTRLRLGLLYNRHSMSNLRGSCGI